MSVVQSDLVVYGSANMAETDGVTQGGAVAFTKRVMFNDIAPAGTVQYVSESAETITITVTGRDATGAVQTETKTPGTTPTAGAQSFERILKGVKSASGAVGHMAVESTTAVVTGTAQAVAAATTSAPASITLAAGQGASVALGQIVRITGGTAGVGQIRMIVGISGDLCYLYPGAWGTLPTGTITYRVSEGLLFEKTPNEVTEVRRPFYGVSADVAGGAARTFYEKVFFANNNTATALTGASIAKQVDPAGSGTLQIALTSALNDAGTVANRQTAPASGITAFTSGAAPQSISVPAPGNLPSGAAPNAAGAQGVWMSLALPAGAAAQKTSFTLRAAGSTT